MSVANVIAFVAEMRANMALQARIEALPAETAAEFRSQLVELANEIGFEVAEPELCAVLEQARRDEAGELGDDDIDELAGGKLRLFFAEVKPYTG